MSDNENIRDWSFYIDFLYSVLLFVIGVPGNILIIYYFQVKTRSSRNKSFNILISLVATADLVVCLFRFCSKAFYFYEKFAEETVLMYFIYIIPFIASDISVWVLWGLSFDRNRRLTKPMQKQFNRKMLIWIFILSFVMSFIIYFPFHLFININPNTLVAMRIAKLTFSTVFMAVLPIWYIVRLFQKTSLFLKKQSDFVRRTTLQLDEHNKNMIALNTLKALTISMIITVAIPRFLLEIENGIGFFGKITIGEDVYKAIECFVYNLLFTNNAINIFIYLKLIKKFQIFVSSSVCGQKPVQKEVYTLTTVSTRNQDHTESPSGVYMFIDVATIPTANQDKMDSKKLTKPPQHKVV